MVFSDADPTFSISSLLSRFDPTVAAGTNSSAAPRPVPSRVNSDKKPLVAQQNGSSASKTGTSTINTGTTQSRPSITSTSKPTATTSSTTSTTASTTTNTTIRTNAGSSVPSSKTDVGGIVKKRKVDDPQQSSMEMLKQRAALLAKVKKPNPAPTTAASASTHKPTVSKISTAGTRPGTTRPGTNSAGNTPTEAVKKPGYKELLARAAQAQAEKKSAPGTITHKARPQVKEQRAWQKKLEEQKAGKAGVTGNDRNSKSPGVASGNEKGSTVGKKSGETVKTTAGKKGVGGVDSRRSSVGNIQGAAGKGKLPDRGKNGGPAEAGTKRKREDTGYSGGSGRAGGYASSRKNNGRRYDTYEEDEEDDFVVDDEDDVPARGPRYGGGGGYSGGGKKYIYYESDYDSGSDMEAAGIDVLEEEERSRRVAILEDQAEEKREKELAAKKAAAKKKLLAAKMAKK